MTGYLGNLLLQANSQAALRDNVEINMRSPQDFRQVLNLKKSALTLTRRLVLSGPDSQLGADQSVSPHGPTMGL